MVELCRGNVLSQASRRHRKMAIFDVQLWSVAMTLPRVHTCAHRDRWSDSGCASMSIAAVSDLAGQAILDAETMKVHVSRNAFCLIETATLALGPASRPTTRR
jgi:hypothetical protein